MANSALYAKLQEIHAGLKVSASSLRSGVYDLMPHIFELDAKEIEQELLIQVVEFNQPGRKAKEKILSKTFGRTSGRSLEEANSTVMELAESQKITEEQRTELRAAIAIYIKQVQSELETTNAKKENFQIETLSRDPLKIKLTYIGSSTGGSVRVKGQLVSEGSVYAFIQNALTQPTNVLLRKIKTILKAKVASSDILFNIGHITGIASLQVDKALTELRSLPATQSKIQESLTLEVLSKFSNVKELSKSFEFGVVYARPQSDSFNNLQAAYEKALKDDLANSLGKVLKNTDWATQESSASLVQAIEDELAMIVVKFGGRANTRTRSRSPGKATLKIEGNRKTKTRRVKASHSFKASPIPTSSGTSVRDLVPILNERLPETIKKNMGQAGRLENRAGRFAESAQIVDFGNGATMTYTYMKMPYQVFEEHSTRDPRPLIEGSIRELAVGLVSQKFNLRRL